MTRQIVLFGLMMLAACATEKSKEERPAEGARTAETEQMDREFITKAASGGMFEVESARLALSRQTPNETTELAQTLMRDHSQANDKLEELAESKALELPKQMLPEDEQKLTQLRTAQGEQFVQLFEQVQEQTHRDTISLFERCVKYCQDMEIRDYATSTLPTLREHMQRIQQLKATAERTEEQARRQQPEVQPQGEPGDQPE